MIAENQHIIEWFVLGASAIMLVYHAILFAQQRDRYILLYSNYLLSLVIYLTFRRWTHYDTFTNDTFSWAYVIDHPLILYMLMSYVLFISRVLEINNNARVIKFAVISFYVSIAVFFIIHCYKVVFTDEVAMSRDYFLWSKSVLLFFAFTGLYGALKVRKSTFVRMIIAGGILYAFFSLLTVYSIYTHVEILGLYEYELYFIGCLLDILLFSSALGYRSYLINQEKIQTQRLLTIESEKNKELLQLQHALLQKKNDLREAQDVMNRQLQNEVGASLSSIHLYAELAGGIVATNPDKSQEYLERISGQSKQIMEDIGDIIWLANIPKEEMHEALLSRIRNYSHEILNARQIAVEYRIEPSYYLTPLTPEVIKETLASIKSAMKDAIDQIGGKKMVLEIRGLPDQFSISFV